MRKFAKRYKFQTKEFQPFDVFVISVMVSFVSYVIVIPVGVIALALGLAWLTGDSDYMMMLWIAIIYTPIMMAIFWVPSLLSYACIKILNIDHRNIKKRIIPIYSVTSFLAFLVCTLMTYGYEMYKLTIVVTTTMILFIFGFINSLIIAKFLPPQGITHDAN